MFKAWKHIKFNGNNNIDNFINKNINSKKQNLVKINKNYTILKEMKEQLVFKRKVNKEKDILNLIQNISELNKSGNITGIWKIIKNTRK